MYWRFVFERRIARHADQSEGVRFAGAWIDQSARRNNRRRRAWKIAPATLALLQQKLAAGGAFPERLIDFIDLRKTFLRRSCFSHYFLLSMTSAAVVPRLRP
jgi:hypothetical protein